MTNKDKSLRDWAEQGEQLLPQTWEQMPDIYLYMDQVITCLQGMLKFYDIDEKNPLITNSMINNYVKNGVVERPVKKKYSRSHLARLYMISCSSRCFRCRKSTGYSGNIPAIHKFYLKNSPA